MMGSCLETENRAIFPDQLSVRFTCKSICLYGVILHDTTVLFEHVMLSVDV